MTTVEPYRPHEGKIVLVTGGARGIGRDIVREFARAGAYVVVNYFHAVDEAEDLSTELRATGARHKLLRGSVAKADQVQQMFEQINTDLGRLDILINNAASGALSPLDTLTSRDWERAINTNILGALWCSQQAAPLMTRRGGGAIINLSSTGASSVLPGYAAIGTTKAAVEALTRYLAAEYAPRNIRVNTASAGPLDTPVLTRFPSPDTFRATIEHTTPLGHRLGKPAELTALISFLASPQASWITGQTILADGGLSLNPAPSS
ncbi:SDR family oxidoreductase [Amycolatopsis sp. NPDC059021]|uniref:SDR family oxidoreductase n=1 Tax=Amycolatopsis sp. NPDC059021 TaxID=3346704 RepID=UPI00367088CA